MEFRFQARRCRAFREKLGLIRGLAAYVKCQRDDDASAPIKLRVPRLKSPLVLRAGADLKVFQQVFVDGQYDLERIDEPRLIIDAGAHIGLASVFFAMKYPHSNIIAIEPETQNFALLCQNVTRFPNVTPVRAALWHRPEILTIANPHADSWMFQMEPASSADGNDTTIGLTIGEILSWCGASEIDLLKLDVEGAEKEIFAAARYEDWLSGVRQIVVELHDLLVPGCTESLEEAVRGQEFSRSTSGECLVMHRF